jgi:hypothetical protein
MNGTETIGRYVCFHSSCREIKLLKKLKHKNVIQLLDAFCKAESQDTSDIGIFDWFSTIELESITWKDQDGKDHEGHVNVLKWYLIFEHCPCSVQTLMESVPEHRLPESQAQR